jgi:hypothetical protein
LEEFEQEDFASNLQVLDILIFTVAGCSTHQVSAHQISRMDIIPLLELIE